MSMPKSKISLRCSNSRIRQALRRVMVSTSKQAEMMPAKPLRQQESVSLMLFLRKRKDQKQLLKQSSKEFISIFDSFNRTSILDLSTERFSGIILNIDDSTFSIIVFISSLSSRCSSRLADRRMNCSPASFFMSEFTFTFDISCIMASSSSLQSRSIAGYKAPSDPLVSFAFISLAISTAMASAALGASICLMKISRAMFLLGMGTSALKIPPRTDLLLNCAQKRLVVCIRRQKGMQTTLPCLVTNTSFSYILQSPILRYKSTMEGSSC